MQNQKPKAKGCLYKFFCCIYLQEAIEKGEKPPSEQKVTMEASESTSTQAHSGKITPR